MAFHVGLPLFHDLQAIPVNGIDLIVIVSWVVVVQVQAFNVRIDREIDGINIAGVSPATLFVVIVRGVLRIVYQNIDVLDG